MQPDYSYPLSEATPGQLVRVSKVGDEPSTLDYLGEHGLVPGRLLSVREAREVDGVVIVEDEEGESHALGGPLARAVFVRGAPR
jgi:DtxR family transcriptional regulator, Mn-dependent transcriptional regulator